MARAVLAHGFGTLHLARVIGLTWPENVASQRVLERIGMVREGSGQYYGREMLRYAAAPP
jgi:ribosomal-protein-alanine N-acetyltransferase